MNIIAQLTKRNIKVFLRNKAEVFYSFLGVFIILGLYVLFLGDVQVKNYQNILGDLPGIKGMVYAWMMSGLVAVSSVTLSLGALGRMVQDREKKVFNDFMVAPIKRWQLILGYACSTLIISGIISLVLFGVSDVIVYLNGGEWMSITMIVKALGVIVLCVLSSCFTFLLAVSFIHSENVFSLVSTMVGTLIGFVTGAYMPMGIMPRIVQNVCNLIPISQGASLLRHIYMDDLLTKLFTGAPAGSLSEYRLIYGVDLTVGKILLTNELMILYLIGSIIIFMIVNVIRFKKMKG